MGGREADPSVKFTTELVEEFKAVATKTGQLRVRPDGQILEVAPATREGVAELLRIANRERIVVRTRLFPFGAEELPPVHYRTVHLDLSKLEGIVQYSPADFVMTVQAGTKLKAIQDAAAASGQWLPIDPPAETAMTIGEIVAKNEFGPRRTGYGTIRDHLLGATWATPDGTLRKTGGLVVKAATGYDLHKLQIGALESLGVGIEFIVRLRAKPAAQATVVAECSARGDAIEKALRVRDLPDAPAALFVLSNLLTKPGSAPLLAVRYEGIEGAVDVAAARCAPAMGSHRLDAAESEKLLAEAREAGLDPGFRSTGRHPLTVRLACRPSKLLITIHVLTVALERYRHPVSICAHPATGIADLWIPHTDDLDPRSVLDDLRGALVRAGGGHLRLRRPFEVFGGTLPESIAPDPALVVMQRLKDMADPHHLLNPGILPFPSRAHEFTPDVPPPDPVQAAPIGGGHHA
jgi:glycolate oxidase FAD binding subunit